MGIDVIALRNGNQFSLDQTLYFTSPVDEKENLEVLKSIKDLTTPRTNGYGAKLFKVTWSFTKTGIINAVQDLFF